MVQAGSLVNIVDNAGGTLGRVFKVLGASKKRYAGLGEKVIISVKVANPRKMVKKKDVHQAVVVRTRSAYRRKDGSYIRFDDNAVVILEKDKNEPKAGRVFGPMPRELAEKGFQKIISLAEEVL
jgi:large subunit ribosomal protein L14